MELYLRLLLDVIFSSLLKFDNSAGRSAGQYRSFRSTPSSLPRIKRTLAISYDAAILIMRANDRGTSRLQ